MKIALLTTDNRENDRDYHDPEPRFGTAPEALLQGFASLPDVEVHVISCVQQPVNSPERIAPNICYHSLQVPKLGWLRTAYQGCIRAVRKKLRSIQPDIVHGQGTERDCAISAVFSGFPNVVTIHGNMQAIAEIYGRRIGGYHRMAAWLETFVLGRTDGVFCNSAYTEDLVRPRTQRIWRVANALRAPFFEQPPASHPPKRPVILNIGAMETRKQQLELLRAASLWRKAGMDFELHFVGNPAVHTDYGWAFAQEFAGAQSAGFARHLGMLSTERLIAAMDSATALIHFPKEEAFGLVVAEALARNLKFFGARVGGVPDIANGVEGAELFALEDWIGMRSAINCWIAAGCPRPTTAAETMRKRYHPAVIAQKHLEIYQEVLS